MGERRSEGEGGGVEEDMGVGGEGGGDGMEGDEGDIGGERGGGGRKRELE